MKPSERHDSELPRSAKGVDPRLGWARRLQAIAQNGIHYTSNSFDRERFEQVREIAAEIAAERAGTDPGELEDVFKAESGHATPKVDVRGFAFRDDRVLLVRNVDDGLWSPPGGWAEVGESPSDAVEKEVREESGYEARASKLIGVYVHDTRTRVRWPFYAYTLDFLCELQGGTPTAPDPRETTEVRFAAEHDLPQLSIRTTRERLARAWTHRRDPSLPTFFE